MEKIKVNLREAVHTKIKELNPAIADLVVERLAQETIEKRVALVCSVMTEMDNLEKTIKRIKPNVKTYNDDGTERAEYSKDEWENKKKITERFEKLKKLLEAALEDGSKFGDLQSFIGQHDKT
jgi:hypothetical protein